jgi:hypothetical protein
MLASSFPLKEREVYAALLISATQVSLPSAQLKMMILHPVLGSDSKTINLFYLNHLGGWHREAVNQVKKLAVSKVTVSGACSSSYQSFWLKGMLHFSSAETPHSSPKNLPMSKLT